MAKNSLPKWATTVTPFSKYLAMVIFIVFPFIGFYIGLSTKEPQLKPPPTIPPVNVSYPTPMPTVAIPATVDELRVSRSITPIATQPIKPIMIPFKTITDSAAVQKLYDTMLELPLYPTLGPNQIPDSCVKDPKRVLYDLNFLRHGKLVQHGILSLLACSGGWYLDLDGTYKREFTDPSLFAPFRSLLANTFGITVSKLDGNE